MLPSTSLSPFFFSLSPLILNTKYKYDIFVKINMFIGNYLNMLIKLIYLTLKPSFMVSIFINGRKTNLGRENGLRAVDGTLQMK